jgi:hypothetical protein
MKILCLVCELWLVELFIKGGEVNYWCERCHQEAVIAKPVKLKSLFIDAPLRHVATVASQPETTLVKKSFA